MSSSIASYRASYSSYYAANSASIEASRSSVSLHFSSIVSSITANNPTVTNKPGACTDDDKDGVEVDGQCCTTGISIDGKCYQANGFSGSIIEQDGVGTLSEYGNDADDSDDSEDNDTSSTTDATPTSGTSSGSGSSSSSADGVSLLCSSVIGVTSAALLVSVLML